MVDVGAALGTRSLASTLAGIWSRWRARLLAFFAGQLAVQLLAFVTGILVLRWMVEEEYAKTGVVLGFQAVFSAFVDLGVGGSLISLIGTRGHQREVVGDYVAAARWWRRILMLAVLPFGALAFYLINARQGWAFSETAVLFACIAASLYFSGVAALASAPLLIHQQLGRLYAVSNFGSVARLGGCAALHYSGHLDAVNVTLLGTLVSGVTAGLYWHLGARLFVAPVRSSAIVRREVRVYVAPLIPIAIFYALQGQIGTLLISYFGRSQSIAEITALGRLGQVFTFLSAMFGMLVVPYFASLPREALRNRYVLAVSSTLLIAVAISVIAFAFPQPLQWLLGKRYEHLGHEIGWMVLGASIGFAGGGIWSIHAARKWIFWRGTLVYIAVVTVTQLVWIASFDVSTTAGVLYMGVATSTAALLTQSLVAWLGFQSEIPQTVALTVATTPIPAPPVSDPLPGSP